jgi:hypothetical protein
MSKLEKYSKLKDLVESKDFNTSYKSLNFWGLFFSYFGNLVSIFLAYFLLNKILYAMIIDYITNASVAMVISSGISILFLFIFEFTKRGVIEKFSIEYIRDGFDLSATKNIVLLVASLLFVSGSYYFSISGANELADRKESYVAESTAVVKNVSDSLNNYYLELKKPIQEEINVLRKTNQSLLSRISETDNLYEQKNYNKQIDNNNTIITANETRILKYDEDLQNKIKQTSVIEENSVASSVENNKSNVIIFLIISTLIEFAIIIGVFFNKLYLVQSYKDLSPTNEPLHKKYNDYLNLLTIIYKNGDLKQGDDIIGELKLVELCKTKNLNISRKTVKDFITEMTYNKVFEVVQKKRLVRIGFDDAKKLLKKMI